MSGEIVVTVGVALVVQWLIIYSAVLSALRQSRNDERKV